MRKIIYLILGIVGLVLGVIGAFLPILPTVPFLLVAGWGFANSSSRLDSWFRSTKLYKNNLESFSRGQGMTVATKVRIIVTVTVLMAIGFIMMKETLVGRICISIVWVAHIVAFVFFVKTKKADAEQLLSEDSTQQQEDTQHVYDAVTDNN